MSLPCFNKYLIKKFYLAIFVFLLVGYFNKGFSQNPCGVPTYVAWNGLPSSIYSAGAIVGYQSGGVWGRYQSIYSNNANVPTNTGWWTYLGCCAASPTPTANAGSLLACSSFTANWSAASNTTQYFLDVSTVSNFASFVSGFQNRNVGNVTSFSVTGLNSGVSYFYRVRAGNSCLTSGNSGTITAITLSIPAAPSSTVGSNLNCTSFSANWTASAGATAYFIDVNTNNTFTGTAIQNNVNVGNVTTLSITGLTAGTNYYYRVRANNTCGTSGSSSTITATTLSIPVAPTANAASSVTCSSFSANWAAVAGASTYFIDVNTNNTFTGTAIQNNVNVGNVITLSITGLTAGTNYYYRIRANNACGTSVNSGTITATTLSTLVAPTANAASTLTCSSFSANWTASAGATAYFIDVNTNNTFTGTAIQNNVNVGNVTTLSITGLTVGTNYYYRIRANNACGTSGSSSTITATTLTTLAAPTANAASALTCSSFSANWTAVSGATAYFIDVNTNNTFTGTAIQDNVNVGNVTTLSITGLTVGTSYYYRIRANNTCGTSVNSGTITATTLTTLAAPTANAASTLTCSSFSANWAAVAGASTYFIDVNTNNTFTGTAIQNNVNVGNVTTLSITGLTAGTNYLMLIRNFP